MNIKVLLVDDEKIIRRGLRKIIEKNCQGYTIIDEAENGYQALESCKNSVPDLVISDVKMPVMNGIELTKKLKKHFPQVKIIMLSGFDDYEYVRSSYKYGSIDYILKPIKNDEFIKFLEELKQSILKQKIKDNQVANNLMLLREKFFINYINGLEKDENLRKRIEALNLDIENMSFTVAYFTSIKKKKFYENKDVHFTDEIQEHIIEKINNKKIYVCKVDLYNLIIIYFHNQVDNLFYDKLLFIQKFLVNNYCIDCRIGISNTYKKFDEIKQGYLESKIACNHRLYENNKIIIYYKDYRYNSMDKNSINDLERQLINAVEISEPRLTKDISCKIIQKLKLDYISPLEVYKYIKNVFAKLSIVVKDFESILEQKPYLDNKFNENIERLNDFYELSQYYSMILSNITRYIQVKRREEGRKIVSKVKEYIDNHYQENINLKGLAKQFNINETYLSEIFYQDVKENYIDYLIRTRLEAAKKYLQDPKVKIYEVGYLVGYNDPAYFSRIFKKKYGLTPSQYRESI